MFTVRRLGSVVSSGCRTAMAVARASAGAQGAHTGPVLAGAQTSARALATSAWVSAGSDAASVSAGVVAPKREKKNKDEPAPTGSLLDIVEERTTRPAAVMRRDWATARLSNVKTSQKKVEPVLTLIRGLSVDEALRQLEFSEKRVSAPVRKVLHSAVANAENNFGMRRERMVVSEAWSGRSTPFKRIYYHSRGRFGRKSRYRTHITVKVAHVPFKQAEQRVGRRGKKHTPVDRQVHRVISDQLSPADE